jgi:hypothetical protein
MSDYWSKPYGVRIESSHFAGTFMFDTAEAAFRYLDQQFERVQRIIEHREYGSSWVNLDLNRSKLITPQGTFQARYVLNVSELSSSNGLVI